MFEFYVTTRNMKDKILELRSQGMTYKEISETVPCSLSNVCYYLGKNQKQKNLDRKAKNYNAWETSLMRSISRFACGNYRQKPHVIDTTEYTWKEAMKKLNSKLKTFACTTSKSSKSTPKKTYMRNKNLNKKLVLSKYNLSEEEPYFTCTYTGKKLNIKQTGTYHLDHIMPRSRGEELGMSFEEINSLENLQIISAEANQAKSSMTHDEFVELCRGVVERHG